MHLIVVCAWCGKVIGFRKIPEKDKPPLPITHSICPACSKKLEEQTEKILQNQKSQSTTRKEIKP